MRSFPKPQASSHQSNSGCTNDTQTSQHAVPLNGGASVKLRGPVGFYHGDPDVMDTVNLLNTNPQKCHSLFGVNDPKLKRKIYFFNTLAAIKFLRNPALEIDVMQYEYSGGAVCFLVGETGAKEELISKGFLFLHECFLASPVKAFIDLDFPPSEVSDYDFNVMLTRANNWINRFRLKVNSALEGIMISIKRAEKAARAEKASKPKKSKRGIGPKGIEKERKKFKHEWSIQAAHRLPGKGTTSKISFHIINNSTYDGKPLLFADIVHLDRFLKNIQHSIDTPNGFKIDSTFTYRGKTLRCLGASKRSEPERMFVEVGTLGKPFSFGCVQPDALDFEHYVISTVCPSTMFDDLYPEDDFLPGCSRHKNSAANTEQRVTKYSCTNALPLLPRYTDPCKKLIFFVTQYLAKVVEYKHVACVLSSKSEDYPYRVHNIKTNQNRDRVDIGIESLPKVPCLLGNRKHNDGKGSTALQLQVWRTREDNMAIVLKCRGGNTTDGHPIDTLDVGHLGGGPLELKSDMLAAAEVVIIAVLGNGTAAESNDVCEDE